MRELTPCHVEAIRVAAISHTGPYWEMEPTFQKMFGWAGRHGLFGPATRCIGIFFDDPRDTPVAELRAKACVSIDDDFVPNDPGIEVTEVPAGEYGKVVHVGPYEKLGETYAWIHDEWLPQSGREFDDRPCFEIYLDDPSQTDPEALRTEVHVPLRS